jgi:lipopolysaccharide transport system permease protein
MLAVRGVSYATIGICREDTTMSIHGTADDAVWRIQPSRDSFFGQLAAVWRYRSVSVALAQQVIANRSRRKLLGLPWMYVQPVVFTLAPMFIRGKVFNVSVAPLPLPMFIVSGLAIWMLTRRGLQQATRSLKMCRALGSRIHVPAFMFVCASLSPALVQFSLFAIALVALGVYYGPITGTFYIPIGWHFLAIVPSILLVMLLVIALGCITSILYSMRQDTILMLKYALSGWMLITPIVYPPEIIPENHRWLLYVNPLTPLVELFRYALFGYGKIDIASIGLSVALVFILLIAGGTLFSKLQSRIFDSV